MGPHAWLTLIAIVATMALLASERFAAWQCSSTPCCCWRGHDQGQAFSDFSNPAPITVAALYVVAGRPTPPGRWSASPAGPRAGSPGPAAAASPFGLDG